MKYYSSRIFYSLIAIYTFAVGLALFYWFASFALSCWAARSSDECVRLEFYNNIFSGVIPMLFVVLSTLIIIFQQKGRKKFGYFMIPLLLISPFSMAYLIHAFTWFDIGWFFSGVSQPGAPISQRIFSLIGAFILLLISITPFYVLIKLIREDFFKNRKIIK